MNSRTEVTGTWGWIAERSDRLARDLVRDADVLGLVVSRSPSGATVIDCGIGAPGSWEAGRRIVEICHGGMARAEIGITEIAGVGHPTITVDSWLPERSAYGMQVSIPLIEIYPALRVSGPIAATFDRDRFAAAAAASSRAWGIAVLETDRLPDERTLDALAWRGGRSNDELTVIAVPTRSITGATQIAGRINECVLFTMKESLGIDIGCVDHIVGEVAIAAGSALAMAHAPTPDDYIHYAGRVVLTLDAEPGLDVDDLASKLTFRSTPAYGRRFADLLDEAGGVFEAIPGLNDLNKVAHVTVIDRRTGKIASAGARDDALLAEWMLDAGVTREAS